MTTIADRVREARLAKGMSQTALAGSAFSPSYISLIEAGRREPTDAALIVLAERLGTTADFLRLGDDAPNEARVRLALDRARKDLVDGDPDSATRRVLELDLNVVTPRMRYDALFVKARALEMAGDLEGSIQVLEPLYADRVAAGDLLELGKIATDLVVTYLEAGDLNRSVEVGERALSEMVKAGLEGTDEHLRLGSALLWSYVERGDIIYAAQQAAELIRVAEQHGSPRGRGSVYWNAAVVAEERRDYDLAQEYTRRALTLLEEGKADRDLPRLRGNYAWLLLRSDPPAPLEALEQLDLAEASMAVLGSVMDRARSEAERARAYLLVGELDASREHAGIALALLGESPRMETATALITMGDVLVARSDVAGAAQVYERAASMLALMSANRQSAQVWRDLGDRYLFRGQTELAALAFDKALRDIGLQSTIPTEAMLGNPLTGSSLHRVQAAER